jgi:hypothetical protein
MNVFTPGYEHLQRSSCQSQDSWEEPGHYVREVPVKDNLTWSSKICAAVYNIFIFQ